MTQLRTGLRWGLGLLVAVGLFGMAGGVRGQALPDLLAQPGEVQTGAFSRTPRTFGTANETVHVVGAAEFEPMNDSATFGYTGLSKFSNAQLIAPVRLPAGAVVNRVELESCDQSNVSLVQFALIRATSPAGTFENVTGTVGTGLAETPGCGFVSTAPLAPLVIDNATNTYTIVAQAPISMARLTAVRVYYTLQVSPAPAVATFADVPTSHPFFQFVEALTASGITVGCGDGNSCPDAPLTRGQLAVFLSVGLELHFAP